MDFFTWLFSSKIEKLKHKRDIQGLVKALDSKEEDMRKDAALALGEIGDASATEPLITALIKNQNFRVGEESWRKSSLDDTLIEALGKLGKPAVEPLIAIIKTEDRNSGTLQNFKELIIKALIKVGEPAIEPLLVALPKTNGYHFRYLAEVLGEIGDVRAITPLITFLKDENESVRYGAIEALGQIGDIRAVEPLIGLLSEDGLVRYYAVTSLRNIPDVRATEPLIAMLKNLIRNEKDGMTLVTTGRECIGALVAIGDIRAVEPLIDVLQNTAMGFSFRAMAAHALDALGWKPGQDETGATYWIARKEWANVLQIGRSAVEPLIVALSDRDAQEGVTKVLGKIGDVRAVEPLISILTGDRNISYQVKLSAAKALGEIGDVRAVEPLIRLLDEDWSMYRDGRGGNIPIAADALVKIGEAAIEPLTHRKLSTVDERIRRRASDVLDRIRNVRSVS